MLITLLDGTRDRAAIRAEFAERTGMRLSAEDLDANLVELARLFLARAVRAAPAILLALVRCSRAAAPRPRAG